MAESQSSSEPNEAPAAESAESFTSGSASAGELVSIKVWERTLAEVRRLSEELAEARERAARAEAEASFLREVLGAGSRTTERAAPADRKASAREKDDAAGIFDVQDESTSPTDDAEAHEQQQQALRKAIAEQLRTYTEQRARERRRPWKRS